LCQSAHLSFLDQADPAPQEETDVSQNANASSTEGEFPERSTHLIPSEIMLNRRIDEIMASRGEKKPWYREAGLIISAAAFFISILTTVVSGYRNYQQDLDSTRAQLRASIRQAGNIAIQFIELMAKYEENKQIQGATSRALNGQNIIIKWSKNNNYKRNIQSRQGAWSVSHVH
jgi:hypothetical protein